ncbi:hypothetical protein EGW08_006049 [Elysia chlorotica]|uniref:G-protein coupled receptors family 3 profile domain-containing protein n=1 Tax=Elysia chlorotica TaxID=188477 RepID=A0A3S1BQD2_ELYCH|nr:hypothetical protein EGW08_006049 [Elysia chlorotica]
MARVQQEVDRLCNSSWRTSGDLLSADGVSGHQIQRAHSAVYIVALALGCVSLALSVACLIFNVLSRHNRVVKMSSPRLNVVISCGGILASCVCMLLAADYFLDTSMAIGHLVCQAKAALLAVSFTLVFGPMVGKTWRVNQIFRLAGAKRVIIKDVRLVAFTTILLCVDIIWTLLWNFLDPLQLTSIIVFDKGKETSAATSIFPTTSGVLLVHSGEPSSLSTVAGCSSAWSTLWLAALFLYKAPFLVWGLREAWWTRGHILPAINDSACLACSSITTAAAMLVYLMVGEAFRKWPTVVDACALVCIWISTMVSISFVFIPKYSVDVDNDDDGDDDDDDDDDDGDDDVDNDDDNDDDGDDDDDDDDNDELVPERRPRDSIRDGDDGDDCDDGDDGQDGRDESPHWSGMDGGQSSSADEGGLTSEEVNSSLDNGRPGEGHGHSCCLHGQACQAGGGHDDDKGRAGSNLGV